MISVRGSGSVPTISASSADGRIGFMSAGFGFFSVVVVIIPPPLIESIDTEATALAVSVNKGAELDTPFNGAESTGEFWHLLPRAFRCKLCAYSQEFPMHANVFDFAQMLAKSDKPYIEFLRVPSLTTFLLSFV